MAEEVIAEVPKEGVVESSPFSEGLTLSEMNESVLVGAPKAPEGGPEQVEGKYLELLSKVTPTKTVPAQITDHQEAVLDAKYIGAMTDEASKVQKLLDLAQTRGVAHAVKVARSLRDYYALDMMHDELSDKLYQGLLEKGLIEKE